MTDILDGFRPYTLTKPYGERLAGDVLRVDADRATWLDANGYGPGVPELPPTPATTESLPPTPTATVAPELDTPALVADKPFTPTAASANGKGLKG